MTSSRRMRGEIATGASPPPVPQRVCTLPLVNATISWFGSTAAVISAIAALPTRGRDAGHARDAPARHRTRHVEREQRARARRLDV